MNLQNEELKELKSYFTQKDKINTDVSQVDVAWHLAHSLKVINQINKAVGKSNPKEFKSSFNLYRSLFFMLNRFPRGRAKAPKSVRPPEVISLDFLNELLVETELNLYRFEGYDAKAHFTHPYFGQLNKKQTIQFLKLHTRHHLKIIKDILN